MEFAAKVEQYIRKHGMLAPGDCVIIGVSGGADSMCLLHVLDQLRERLSLKLVVVHINHGIRGDAAAQDEEFVRQACRKCEIEFRSVHAAVPELAKAQGISEEEAGRQVRYQAFEDALEEFHAQKIAVAHHANDNAETFLFHAFRGSGLKGLGGMAPMRGKIIRPLLDVSRKEIEEYLDLEGISYCTDASNLTMEYARNRIRNAILPMAVEEINAGAVNHLAEAAKELNSIYVYIEIQAERAYEQALVPGNEIGLAISRVRELPEVLQREVVKMALWKTAGSSRDLTRVHIEMCLALMDGQSGRRVDLPYELSVCRSYDTLCFTCGKEEVYPCTAQEITSFPAVLEMPEYSLRLSLQNYENNKPIPKNRYTKWFDYDKINGTLTVRTRQSGDYLVIHEDGRKKSLKVLLNDMKVPAKERDSLSLLAVDHRILWVLGRRAEEGLYVNENTKCILVAELEKKG